jgi:membrane glycosyltransferase
MLNFGLNVLLVLLFSVHVYFAFKGFRDSKIHLMNLLRQGVVDNVFRHSRKMLYLLLIPAVVVTGIATWSFYNVLTYCGASDLILYIILAIFACYSMIVITAFLFCKVLQIAAHKAGL